MSNITFIPILIALTFGSWFVATDYGYNGSTAAAVAISGGIIRAENNPQPDSKYKRSECPICKGKGTYKSGDGIKDVDCGYCEPDKAGDLEPPDVLLHPPVIIETDPNCKDGKCLPPKTTPPVKPKTTPPTTRIYRR